MQTCAYKHHVVVHAVCSFHLVHYDLCERSSPAHQYWLISDWLDNLVHEGLVFDKLKGPIWEVQSLSYAQFTSHIIYTLVKEGR